MLAELVLWFFSCANIFRAADARVQGGTPHGSVRAGLAARDHPTAPARIRAAGGHQAAWGIGHPPGDSLKLGWDMGP